MATELRTLIILALCFATLTATACGDGSKGLEGTAITSQEEWVAFTQRPGFRRDAATGGWW